MHAHRHTHTPEAIGEAEASKSRCHFAGSMVISPPHPHGQLGAKVSDILGVKGHRRSFIIMLLIYNPFM